MGFSGERQTLPYTTPLVTQIGSQTLEHSFVYSPSVPVNLLGRDLLTKLGATILCSADGLVVTLPDGTLLRCSDSPGGGQYLLQQSDEQYADIYWGKLHPESPDTPGVLSAYLKWKPWITHLEPYFPPPDPPHVTLFYDRLQTEWYEDRFQNQLQGEDWTLQIEHIYVAPEGVAAGVKLTAEQQVWYRMSDEAAPHVSLAIHPKHQAKELGGVVKRALAQTDWVDTDIPFVQYSQTAKTSRIYVRTTNTATLEHELITRHHGREKTDHYLAAEMVNSLPDHLWADGPTDVGLTNALQSPLKYTRALPCGFISIHTRPRRRQGFRTQLQVYSKRGC